MSHLRLVDSAWTPETRTISKIASEVFADWKNVSPHAKVYLNAMVTMQRIEDNYGLDSGSYIVNYFLANAQSWRGDKAKAIKSELKKLLKNADMDLMRSNVDRAYKRGE